MHTRFLQALVRISQVGSFSRVADELNTTLSTVSMQMKALEDDLGVQLFDRSHRPPLLTPVGRTVTAHASSMLESERQLIDACGVRGQLAGTFRMGFVATASVRLLPGFLKNATIHAPAAEFQLETALSEVLEQRVLSGQLDAAVVTETEEEHFGLSVKVLREEAMKFALPPGYEKNSIAELFELIPFLQFNPGSGIGQLIEKKVRDYFPRRGLRIIVLDSVEAIMACVNEGLGFTLLTEPDIHRYASEKTCLRNPYSGRIVRRLSLISASREESTKNLGLLADLFSKQ